MNNKKPQLGNIRDYVLKYFPETLWWDGFHKHEVFNTVRAYKHRQGLPNEIRIEFDYEDRKKNWDAILTVSFNLTDLGYSYAVYETEGGRGPHLHIYDLDELGQLDIKQRKEYREKFITKISEEYVADMGLCDEKHLCALEFANHFKYNKPKKLIVFVDNGYNSKIELDIKLNILHGKKKLKSDNVYNKKLKFGDMLRLSKTDIIIKQCSFEKIFKKYEIKYKGKMALCPFHKDGNGSLSFSNKKGLWKCFGSECGAKGNIFTLIKMLRELKK